MNNIIEKDASELLSSYYLDYGMSVITERSLPDIRDNLKPVQRRILYDAYTLGIFNDKPYKKSARIVGDTLGRFHAHGDSSVYGALCRLGQWFSLKEPLFEPHGNVGKLDGSPASAMRYTETKLSKFGELMLKDINKNTVDFIPNFDGEEQEPSILPSAFPNFLVNGNMGMAVGFSTNVPTHNLQDAINQIIYQIDNPNCEIKDLVDILKAPDFPTGGQIINPNSMLKMYETGEGKIKIRGKYHIEDEYDEDDETKIINKDNVIIFTEIPFDSDINTHKITDIISDCAFGYSKKEKGKKEEKFYPPTIPDIKKVSDLTSDIEGVKIKIVVKHKSKVNKVLGLLFKKTPLEHNFSALFNAVKNKKLLEKMDLKQINNEYIDFRKEIITNRSKFELDKANDRKHILEGLIIALNNIDEVISIIRSSKTNNDAKILLSQKFNLSDKQSNSIIELKLKRLTNLEINKIKEEYDNLIIEINKLNLILSNEKELLNVVKLELREVADKYGKPRQTEIIQESDIEQLSKSELIEEYNCKIAYTSTYIKKYSRSTDSQKTKENETLIEVDIESNNTDTLLVFTNMGNRYRIGCHELQTVIASKSLGDYVYNITTMDKDEQIIKVVSIPKDYKKDSYIVCTYSSGKISKINIESYMSNNKKLQNCYNIDSELLNIAYITKDVDIFMLSNEGKSLILNTSRINPKGSRNSQGATGIKLNEGYKCIASIIGVTKDYNFKLITEKGREKEFMLDDIVSSENERRLFDYIYGRNGNQGNFLINTRTNNDIISKFEIL